MRVKQRYLNTLNGYLNWVTSDFLRPKFEYDPDGLSAAEIMLRWETFGEMLPLASKEPDQLALYVQGKKSRDFYVDNWRTDCKPDEDGIAMAFPEEFLYTLGMDEKEFRSVFGRPPQPSILFDLGMAVEFLRLTANDTDSYTLFLRRCLTTYLNKKAINIENEDLFSIR